MTTNNIPHLNAVLAADAAALENARKHYGESWCKRGGAGAFFMLARKWDRLENHLGKQGFDVLTAIKNDQRSEGVIDDVRDLRRYLALVEAKAVELGFCPPALAKDATVSPVFDDMLRATVKGCVTNVTQGGGGGWIDLRLPFHIWTELLEALGEHEESDDEDDTPPASTLHPA